MADKSTEEILHKLGIKKVNESICTGVQWVTPVGSETRKINSPVDGKHIASITYATTTEYERVMMVAESAFKYWKAVPAPKRGEIVRQIGNALRENKHDLGYLVSYEMGKSLQEGWGEVQEMIDICDFAVGLSRQLYGLTISSERPEHHMMEQWHPLGIVGIISAFNFPVAVWSWNAMIAAVCGNVCIWKPSEKAPLSAIAVHHIIKTVLVDNELPEGIFNLIIGDHRIGEKMSKDKRIPLISATGSTRMGKRVSQLVGSRLGKSILELGGNNAIIVTEDANLENALKASVFGSVGTAGQRCTSTRRLIVQDTIFEKFKSKLVKIYAQLKIGNPLDQDNHVGPLIDKDAVKIYLKAIESAEDEGGQVLFGAKVLKGKGYESGCYVVPTLILARNHYNIVQEETFAPITYLIKFSRLEEAIAMQNDVKQGLSSAIFTDNMKEAHQFTSVFGSDCGIANVNIGTSGAEIGGAFGGEKETGGGRESGSDSWKAYMRRQTNTINFGDGMPLAQGIKFDI
ncbi:MAG: aldehyde dehydrogenase family protein [Flavobacteriales bacterium]|nr:aldehyde dehydrogenase family protein [Flavobacteriales bacterium]